MTLKKWKVISVILIFLLAPYFIVGYRAAYQDKAQRMPARPSFICNLIPYMGSG